MSKNEKVMVVPSKIINPFLKNISFITEDIELIIRTILDNHTYIDRPIAEYSVDYKQIIPYVVMECDSCFYMTKRLKAQTEKRLHGMYSLGIGGHINPSEEVSEDIIQAGMFRELQEEIGIVCSDTGKCRGIINDLSTDVSNYHLGLVYLIHPGKDITISEKKKMTGHWATPEEINSKTEELESWSQILWSNIDKWKK